MKTLSTDDIVARIVFIIVVSLAASGTINSPLALALGFIFVWLFKHPYLQLAHKASKQCLKLSIIGLGFGISLQQAVEANVSGLGLLSVSVILTVIAGLILTAKAGIEKPLGFLITAGTAICGGSAIAAVAPVSRANNQQISIALAVVFALNSLALIIFPPIAKLLSLSQEQFGVWAAIAIHDTSSVVGAAMTYGDQALAIATTLKLSRTLWIIPLGLFAAWFFHNKQQRLSIPYFIVGFLLAIAINSFFTLPDGFTETVTLAAKRLLVVTLFLIGTTLSLDAIKKVGVKPLVFAVILWITVSIISLLVILIT
ncbi:MAG: putative sulfate exporter family transporter [Gammaproteobacteria bacterium]|nr:MAG: putative sulfate exporter family transporter [Gammaproteobacteria bacterium]